MKYLYYFEDKELEASLKKLEWQMGQLKRYSQYLNRASTKPTKEEIWGDEKKGVKGDRSKWTRLNFEYECLI